VRAYYQALVALEPEVAKPALQAARDDARDRTEDEFEQPEALIL
jgi:hypothetical protein